MRLSLRRIIALLIIAGGCSPALAQEREQDPERLGSNGEWKLTGSMGAGASYGPAFYGSEANEISPVPFIDLRYGRFFVDTDIGLGVTLLEREAGPVEFAFGAGIGPGLDGDRDDQDDSRLRGIG